MFAVIAAVLFLIAFVLHWAAKGTSPFDVTGFMLLGLISTAVHLAVAAPWWYHRGPRA
jgi:hypothetical protein